MSAKFNVSSATIRKLMTSPTIKAEVHERALRLAAKANEVPSTTTPEYEGLYYEAVEASDAKRARSRVQTTGPRAVNHEAITQALLSAASSRAAAPAPNQAVKPKRKGRWTAEELGLLAGTGLSNEDIAHRTGRSASAVRAQRYVK